MTAKLSTVHPFPARMASSIAFDELRRHRRPIVVVDPMSGSGTSIVAARLQGHEAMGFDVDPLAVLIATAWTRDVDASAVREVSAAILAKARKSYRLLSAAGAYPPACDDETKAFIRYWFDTTVRRQLTALSSAIQECPRKEVRTLLWCAFSRLIITKAQGASLGMDVSHSRPHRVYRLAPIKPFDHFERAVDRVLNSSPFASTTEKFPAAKVRLGDARRLPLADKTADLVISSPPYLNAIDYIRGHRLSLVWMGHTLHTLRLIRKNAVGSEAGGTAGIKDAHASKALSVLDLPGGIPTRVTTVLNRYAGDMHDVLSEVRRILKPGGRALFVVGDSTTRGVFINTSALLRALAEQLKFKIDQTFSRKIPDNRRYLPPPTHSGAGPNLSGRMRTEVVLRLSL